MPVGKGSQACYFARQVCFSGERGSIAAEANRGHSKKSEPSRVANVGQSKAAWTTHDGGETRGTQVSETIVVVIDLFILGPMWKGVILSGIDLCTAAFILDRRWCRSKL